MVNYESGHCTALAESTSLERAHLDTTSGNSPSDRRKENNLTTSFPISSVCD